MVAALRRCRALARTLACAALASAAAAQSAPPPADGVRLADGEAGTLDLGIEAGIGGYLNFDPWFDVDQAFLPFDEDEDLHRLEEVAEVGIRGALLAPGGSRFLATLSVQRVEAQGTDSFGDDDDGETAVEDAWVGWRSGELAPALGRDGIAVSVGRLPLVIGSGLLIRQGAADGARRGALELDTRESFGRTALLELGARALRGRAFVLATDEVEGPDTETEIAGADLEWTAPRASAGLAGLWVAESRIRSRSEMWVVHPRASVAPFAGAPGLRFGGELAVERKDESDLEALAFATEVDWRFDERPWKPRVGYRYARFSGDDPGTPEPEGFDPLFYGSTEPGTWHQGFNASYLLANTNLVSHLLRVEASPFERVRASLLGWIFRADERGSPLGPFLAGVPERELAEEIDLLVDVEIDPSARVAFFAAWTNPDDGLQNAIGADEPWWSVGFHFRWRL